MEDEKGRETEREEKTNSLLSLSCIWFLSKQLDKFVPFKALSVEDFLEIIQVKTPHFPMRTLVMAMEGRRSGNIFSLALSFLSFFLSFSLFFYFSFSLFSVVFFILCLDTLLDGSLFCLLPPPLPLPFSYCSPAQFRHSFILLLLLSPLFLFFSFALILYDFGLLRSLQPGLSVFFFSSSLSH